MHPLMDSYITKFLVEDEDETSHSSADVEAFTAALNRDIGEPHTVTDDAVDMNMQKTVNSPAQNVTQTLDNAMDRRAGMQVPFGLLLPSIQSKLDKDKAMQLQGLYNRLKSNDINKKEFVRRMRALVGEHMIKMAIYKLEHGQLSAQRKTQKSSPHVATSSIHPSSDSRTLPLENNPQKTRLLEHQPVVHGVQHMDFPQSSFSTCGNPRGNYHTGAGPNTDMSSLSSQMSQGPVHPLGTHGGGSLHFKRNLPNLSHWQPSMHKDQSLIASMAYEKPDHMDQMNEQFKSHVSAPQGPSSFSPGQHEQASGVPGSSKDNTFEMCLRPSLTIPMKPEPRSITAQLERQNVSTGKFSSAAGSNAKTPPKKATAAQKKPLEVPNVSPLSKKQKVCGTFSGQSIEQLNDVTDVSGVNLQEEEEQLFSGSKEESRVSEASRTIVQEEEERLFLQKIPIQKKVAEIMAKCGVKNKSNDVEQCLSRCVEERLHGLITNLIRLSKQRVNIEKPRHRTVITSDIRQQIMSLNQKAREEWEEKQAAADKLQRADEVNKEEVDKMQTTAANVAARAAVGGDDMLSRWQLMVEQTRQKRKSRPDAASGSKPCVDIGIEPKSVSTSERNSSKDNPDTERTSGPVTATATATATCGPRNQDLGHSGDSIPLPRTISVKDAISVLTRESQMSRSTLIHHLCEKV